MIIVTTVVLLYHFDGPWKRVPFPSLPPPLLFGGSKTISDLVDHQFVGGRDGTVHVRKTHQESSMRKLFNRVIVLFFFSLLMEGGENGWNSKRNGWLRRVVKYFWVPVCFVAGGKEREGHRVLVHLGEEKHLGNFYNFFRDVCALYTINTVRSFQNVLWLFVCLFFCRFFWRRSCTPVCGVFWSTHTSSVQDVATTTLSWMLIDDFCRCMMRQHDSCFFCCPLCAITEEQAGGGHWKKSRKNRKIIIIS